MKSSTRASTEGEEDEFNAKYTVINDNLIRSCIQLKHTSEQDDGIDQESKSMRAMKIKRENMDFNEIEHLSFSFKSRYFISEMCLSVPKTFSEFQTLRDSTSSRFCNWTTIIYPK